jgi:hypothetical protein
MPVSLDCLVAKEDVIRTMLHDVDRNCQFSPATEALETVLQSKHTVDISTADEKTDKHNTLPETKSINDFSDVFRSIVSTENNIFDFPEIGWSNDDSNGADDLEEERKLEDFFLQERKRIKVSHDVKEPVGCEFPRGYSYVLSRSRTTWFDLSSMHRTCDIACDVDAKVTESEKKLDIPYSYSQGRFLQRGKRILNESTWLD